LKNQNSQRPFEIIVVDDGSSIDLSQVKESFKDSLDLKWIKLERNRGPAAARNAGVSVASGDLVFFTDADCIPDRDWIEELAKPFIDPQVVGAKGVYRSSQEDFWARLAQMEFEERYECLSSFGDIDFVDTYCGAFRRAKFLEVGGFDENFPKANNEDVDLAFRIKKRGGKFVFVPQARVWHKHREGMVNYLKLKFTRGFWRMKVYRKHPEKAGRDSYTPWTMKFQMLLLLLCPLASICRKYRRLWLIAWLTTCFPLMRITLSKDPVLIPLIPIFVFLRGFSLLAGMLSEIISPVELYRHR